MARRYRRGHHRRGIPILSLAILGGQALYANSLGADLAQKVSIFTSFYTGFQPTSSVAFDPSRLIVGYGPWLAKGFIMKFARPFGAAPRSPVKGISFS